MMTKEEALKNYEALFLSSHRTAHIRKNGEVSLSAPWIIYFKQVRCLFKKDPAVKVTFDQSTYELKLFVEGEDKAKAIEALLPKEKEFGNVVVKIFVILSKPEKIDRITLFTKAFEGNGAVNDILTFEALGSTWSYIVFDKEVVQFSNDDLQDPHGLCSTLYQDIAKEVFGLEGNVFFCTDVSERDDEPIDSINPLLSEE